MSSIGVEPKGTRGANAPGADGLYAPPPLHRIDGRDVAYDALAERCGVRPDDPNRSGEIAVALNGRGARVGIRKLAWNEIVQSRFDGDGDTAAEAVAAEPARFEEALATLIGRRAVQYQGAMRGALLTPTALAKWWLSLEHVAAARGDRMGADEIEAYGG